MHSFKKKGGSATHIYIRLVSKMLPINDVKTVEYETNSKSAQTTWRTFFDDSGERIDGLEAIAQSIYAILRTERYKYPIYSGNHGLYTADLIGQSKRYILAVLKDRITEALLMDDRITAVDGFYIDPYRSKGHILSIGYTIHTVIGNLEGKEELNV